ncbi:response regulator [Beggiatoa alba B18LD]|uniref:Response regulator n=1 Tax=Beggiatoa alba B18LD TaxID=395493 RepID=I3CEI2_9GAMM|nr:response regulator [Beggiatoa alba]EIJ42025.1 response regulator [Beggiatoa alba B18LD]
MPSNFVVYVVDDEKPIRKAVKFFLNKAGFETELLESPDDFLNSYATEKMGCLLLDIHMPSSNSNGLAFQKTLKEKSIDIPVVIMSAHGDIPSAVSAIRAGAMDFIEKPVDKNKLLFVVNECFKYCVANREKIVKRQQLERLLNTLTHRETEILPYLCKGYTSKEVANSLDISSRTVERHRANILRKMQAHSLTSLTTDLKLFTAFC